MKYTRKQINEAISYWRAQLESMEHSKILTEGIFDSIKSLFGGKKDEIDVKGLEKLARTNAMAFATAIACLTDEDKRSIIKNHPESPIAKALPSYNDITQAVEKTGSVQTASIQDGGSSAAFAKKPERHKSSGKKFNFGDYAATANAAQDRDRDAWSNSGTHEREQGNFADKDNLMKYKYLFKAINAEWHSHKKSDVASKNTVDIKFGKDGVKLINGYNISKDILEQIADECSEFMDKEFGLRPVNWKIIKDNSAMDKDLIAFTDDVDITDEKKVEDSCTPDGRKFAASNIENRTTTIKKGDDILELINSAKAKYSIKKDVRGVVEWLNTKSHGSHVDYKEASTLQMRTPAGHSHSVELVCKPDSTENNAKGASEYAVKLFKEVGLDVEFKPSSGGNSYDKYAELKATKIVVADEAKYTAAVKEHGNQ